MKVVKSKRKLTPKPSPAQARLRRLQDNARSKGDQISFKKLRNQCTTLTRKEAIESNMGQIRKEPNSHWRIAKELVGGGRAPSTKLKKGGLDLDY
jgi:hypothetical protein